MWIRLRSRIERKSQRVRSSCKYQCRHQKRRLEVTKWDRSWPHLVVAQRPRNLNNSSLPNWPRCAKSMKSQETSRQIITRQFLPNQKLLGARRKAHRSLGAQLTTKCSSSPSPRPNSSFRSRSAKNFSIITELVQHLGAKVRNSRRHNRVINFLSSSNHSNTLNNLTRHLPSKWKRNTRES